MGSERKVSKMVTLAVSDIHIGYDKSNVKLFNSFLQEIIKRTDVEHFVILGDFVDMWRRDVSGIFLENYETVQLLLEIKNRKTPVHYVAGNHDFHLLKLKGHLYPLEFRKSLSLKLNSVDYIFKHGWEFDSMQLEPVIERLCHNLSDKAGDIRSDIWNWLIGRRDVTERIEEIAGKNAPGISKASLDLESLTMEYLQNLMSSPNVRMMKTEMALPFRSVEKNAEKSVKEGQVLVFGHTHRPLVSRNGRLANAGSWVSDENTPYTYVEIDGSNIRLMQYDGSESNDITRNHLWS